MALLVDTDSGVSGDACPRHGAPTEQLDRASSGRQQQDFWHMEQPASEPRRSSGETSAARNTATRNAVPMRC